MAATNDHILVVSRNFFLNCEGGAVSVHHHRCCLLFGHVVDLLETSPQRAVVDDVGTSLSLLRRALRALAKLNSEDPAFSGLFSWLHQSWKEEVEGHFIDAGVSSKLLQEGADARVRRQQLSSTESAFDSAAVGVQFFTHNFLPRSWVEQMPLEFDSDDEENGEMERAGSLNSEQFWLSHDLGLPLEEAERGQNRGGTTACSPADTLLLAKLNQAFNLAASPKGGNGLWRAEWSYALSAMGVKSLPGDERASHQGLFVRALRCQRSHDLRERSPRRTTDVFDVDNYKIRCAGGTGMSSVHGNLGLLKAAWSARKTLILQGLAKMSGGGDEEALSPLTSLSSHSFAADGETGTAEAAGALLTSTSCVVIMKWTNEQMIIKVAKGSTVLDLKHSIAHHLSIPVAHQKLSEIKSSGSECCCRLLSDSEMVEELPQLKCSLERPILRSVWCGFFLDEIHTAVDEAEARKQWGRIWQCTHYGRAGRRENHCDEYNDIRDIDPTLLFVYADDLRKVLLGFGGSPLTKEEVTTFILECHPKTAAEMKDGGLMTQEDFARPENHLDHRARVYFSGFITALEGN